MFSRYRTKGIVIRKEDYGESDRMLTVYTQDFGKLRIFCKSIRKESSKLRSGSEPYCLIELEFIEGRSRKTLTDVKVIDSYSKTSKDLQRITLVNRIAEDLNCIIKGEEKDQKVWNLLRKSLDMIEEGTGSPAYHRFFWNLISVLGYGPELYHCSQCRGELNPEKLILSPEDGGLVCSSCHSKNSAFPIDEGTIKMIRISLQDDFIKKIKFSSHDERSLWDVSKRYLSLIGR